MRITCSRRGPLPPSDATSSARLRTSDGVAVPATSWAVASSISSSARALKARSGRRRARVSSTEARAVGRAAAGPSTHQV